MVEVLLAERRIARKRGLVRDDMWRGDGKPIRKSSNLAFLSNRYQMRTEDEGAYLVVASLAKRVAQPFETLVKTVSRRGAGGLDVLFDTKLASSASGAGGVVRMLTQARCLRLWRPSLSVISAAFMAF